MTVGIELLIVLLLFLANGVFAMIETAVIGSRKSRLKEMAARGRKGAASALRLAENPNRFLPTVQTGITLVGLLAGAFSGATLAGHLAQAIRAVPALANYAEATAVGAVVVALTFASVVIGELVPKRIALAAPERIASRLAPPIEWMSRASRPVVRLLAAVTDLLLRLFCVKVRATSPVSEEEVRVLLLEGTEAGVFHRDEPRMVASVLAFDRMPVSEIMTPRERISCLSVEDACETLWQKVVLTGHSNYPVCTSDRDHVIGIVSLKSVCANLASGARAPVRELMKAPLFVTPNESVLNLLGHFRESGTHVAVVRGADGRVKGFATLVDVLEAIVGDIPAFEERLRPRPCRGAMVANRPAGSSLAAARG